MTHESEPGKVDAFRRFKPHPKIAPTERDPSDSLAFHPSRHEESMQDLAFMETDEPDEDATFMEQLLANSSPEKYAEYKQLVEEERRSALKQMTGENAWMNDPKRNKHHPDNKKRFF